MSVPALAQRPRSAIGLRGWIVAVVLTTTLATLAFAAVLVLGPLEKSLRRADEQALKKSIPHDVAKRFSRLPLGDLNSSGSRAPHQLARAQQQLQDETGGAFVAVLGDAGLHGSHARVLIPGAGISGAPYTAVASALNSNRANFQVV